MWLKNAEGDLKLICNAFFSEPIGPKPKGFFNEIEDIAKERDKKIWEIIKIEKMPYNNS
jgi:hypothetical protein